MQGELTTTFSSCIISIMVERKAVDSAREAQATASRENSMKACGASYLSVLISAERFAMTPIPASLRMKISDAASAVLHGK
jgi:hypothetical protein